ncbi:hypothetical protein VaNZ11_013661, partial [Volvox africanus]
MDPGSADDELVDCLVGASGITKRQFQAFTTLVDEVYETYGISGEPRSGSSRRRVPFNHQPSMQESLLQPPLLPSPRSPFGGCPRSPHPAGAANHTARYRWLEADISPKGGDGGECSASPTRGSGFRAAGCSTRRCPPAASALHHTSSTLQLHASRTPLSA